jgi:hypothetical protein
VAQSDARRIEIDLHGECLTKLWIVLDGRKRAADDQKRVAVVKGILRRPRAEQADAARRERVAIRNDGLAE